MGFRIFRFYPSGDGLARVTHWTIYSLPNVESSRMFLCEIEKPKNTKYILFAHNGLHTNIEINIIRCYKLGDGLVV